MAEARTQPEKPPVVKEKPKRGPKGYFLPGNTESDGTNKGRPCEYCANRTSIMSKYNLYLAYCNGLIESHPEIQIPYIFEFCEQIGIVDETYEDWVRGDCKKGDHSEIIQADKRYKMLQKGRLLQRTNGNNPTGAIFQLKANHGLIEAEKRILVGDKEEPLTIRIVDEKIDERMNDE